MTYSVWNHAERLYDYYRTPARSAATAAPAPTHLRASSAIGAAPEGAAWPLPADAQHVGRGAAAKGFIAARRSTALGALPFDLTGPNLIVIGIIAFLAYEHWWKPRKETRS